MPAKYRKPLMLAAGGTVETGPVDEQDYIDNQAYWDEVFRQQRLERDLGSGAIAEPMRGGSVDAFAVPATGNERYPVGLPQTLSHTEDYVSRGEPVQLGQIAADLTDMPGYDRPVVPNYGPSFDVGQSPAPIMPPNPRNVIDLVKDVGEFIYRNDPTVPKPGPPTSSGQIGFSSVGARGPVPGSTYGPPVLADTVKPFVGDIGEFLGPKLPGVAGAGVIGDLIRDEPIGTTAGDLGRLGFESQVPTTWAEIALTAAPPVTSLRNLTRGRSFLPFPMGSVDDIDDLPLNDLERLLDASIKGERGIPQVPGPGPGVDDVLNTLDAGVTRESADALGMSPSQQLPPGPRARANAVRRGAERESAGVVGPPPRDPVYDEIRRQMQARQDAFYASEPSPTAPPQSFDDFMAEQRGLLEDAQMRRSGGGGVPPRQPPPPPPPPSPPPTGGQGSLFGNEGPNLSLRGQPTTPFMESAAGPPNYTLPPTPSTATAPFSIPHIPAEVNRNIDAIAQAGIQAVKDVPEAGIGSRLTAPLAGEFSNPVVNEIAHRERELRDAIVRFGDVSAGSRIDDLTGQRIPIEPLREVVKNTPDGREVMRLEVETNRLIDQFREAALQQRYGNNTRAINTARDILKKADVERMAGGLASRGYDAVNNSLRELILNFDILGVTGQQGLRAARGSTAITTGLIGRVAKALGHGPNIYLRGDIDEIAQMMADTVQMGRGGATADITKAGLSRVPVLGDILDAAATFQFEGILGTVRKLAYEGLLMQNKALGVDITNPVVRRRVAEMANVLGSTARPAATPRRAAIEGRSMLSPRMTRAQINEVGLLPKTLRSPTDAINTANWVVSTGLLAAAGYYLNKEIGLDDVEMDIADWTVKHLNPANPEFGRIVTKQKNSQGEYITVDFLPQTSLARNAVRAIDNLIGNDPKGAQAELLKATASRAGPLTGVSGRLGAGVGYDTEGRFYTGDMPRNTALRTSIPRPLGLRGIVAGETDAASIILNQTGVTAFGERGKPAIDRARESARQRMGLDKPYDQLLESDKLRIDAQFDVEPLVIKNLEEQAATGKNPIAENKLADIADRAQAKQEALDLDAQLDAGILDGAAYRKAIAQKVHDLSIASQSRYETQRAKDAVAKIPQRELPLPEQARQSYFRDVVEPARTPNGIDFDTYESRLLAWEQRYPEYTKEQVSPAKPLSPRHEELLAARKELAPYFDLPDNAWANAQEADARFLIYRNAADYSDRATRTIVSNFTAGGVPQQVAEKAAADIVSGRLARYNAEVKAQKLSYLTKNREAIKLLDKWYEVPYGLEALSGVR